MATDGGNTTPRITKAEHIGPNDTGDNIEAKRSANYVWDSGSSSWVRATQATGGGTVANDGSFATPAKQDTGNTSLASIDAKLTNPLPVSLSSDIEIGAVELKNGTDDTRAVVTPANALKVDGSAVTQPVSATSLPLPTGAATAALQTQPGVDIGDVGVLSVIPGTGATNLGKARDSVAGETDTGVAMLGIVEATPTQALADDGDYGLISLTDHKEVRTRDQRSIDLCNCNDSTAVTVLGNDTTGLANSTAHTFGIGALTFNKVNGAANTVYAGVQDTITALDIQEVFESGGFVGLNVYLPTITNVQNVFLRIGTDSSNYNAWTWDVSSLTAATWLNLRNPTSSPDKAKSTGNGWDTNAITYVAFGVQFLLETDTLSGIIFDHVHMVAGRVTSTDIQASITSSVSSPNINLHKVGGQVTDHGAGITSSGTLRVVLPTDQTSIPVTGTFSSTEAVYTTRIDEASGTVTYIGDADPGTATSASSWRVKKIDSSSGTSILFAGGDDTFVNAWDDRASLSYS